MRTQAILDNNGNSLSGGIHRREKEFLWLSAQLQLLAAFAERTPNKMTKVVAVN